MASSSELYSQIQGLMGQINPALDQLPTAEKFYKDETNKAFQYNLPALRNAANLESQLYSMPGELMGQYNEEFGGQTGVSSSQRMNSILGSLGRQGALSNTAWGAADQAGTRIDDLAKTLYGQYKTGIEANQAKLSPLMSMWDRMYAEEQANARSSRSGSAGYSGISYEELEALVASLSGDDSGTDVPGGTNVPSLSATAKADSLRSGSFVQDYLRRVPNQPATTQSPDLNKYINRIRGVE